MPLDADLRELSKKNWLKHFFFLLKETKCTQAVWFISRYDFRSSVDGQFSNKYGQNRDKMITARKSFKLYK